LVPPAEERRSSSGPSGAPSAERARARGNPELYAPREDERAARPKRVAASAAPRGSVRYRIAVGREHGVQPGNIVGAIANEAAIDSSHIGRIDIFDSYSTVDLPEGMPEEIYELLQKAWVCGQKLAIRVDSPGDEPAAAPLAPRQPAGFDRPAKFDKRAKFGKPAKKKHRKGPPPPRR
jgi:ATP-dependent RNA helicase DeaD